MRVVFMGTPDFAAVHLRALAEAGHDIACVYTQPDRPKGRGKQLHRSAAGREAESLGLPIRQPVRLSEASEVDQLRAARPDVIVVVAYGQKLSPAVLSLPAHGCVNIHASLLPKYRGAAPIQWAILRGEDGTGVTSMRMDEGWDTGDILMQRRVPIQPETDAGSLHDVLAEAGAALLVATLAGLARETIRPRPQDHDEATFAPKLRKEDGLIDWNVPAVEIERKVRAFRPWPSTFTVWKGDSLRVWRADVAGTGREGAAHPGTVLSVDEPNGGITVQTGEGAIRLLEVQPANRRSMTALDFANGAHMGPDARFGDTTPGGEPRA